MLVNSSGIVFSAMKYSESDIITRIYTREHGLVSFILKGGQSKKNSRMAYLQPFTLVDLVYNRNEKRELQYLKEIGLGKRSQNIRFDVVKSTIAVFCAEVIQKSIAEQEANIELFDFVEDAVLQLDQTTGGLNFFHIILLVELSEKLGFKPEPTSLPKPYFFDLEGGVFMDRPIHTNFLNEIDSANFNSLLKTSLKNRNELNMSQPHRNKMLEILIEYFRLHLPGMPRVNSLEILSEVFR